MGQFMEDIDTYKIQGVNICRHETKHPVIIKIKMQKPISGQTETVFMELYVMGERCFHNIIGNGPIHYNDNTHYEIEIPVPQEADKEAIRDLYNHNMNTLHELLSKRLNYHYTIEIRGAM